MNDLELEAALQSWGRYYGERPPPEWDESAEAGAIAMGGGYPVNPISTAMDFGARKDRSTATAYARPADAKRFWRDAIPCSESRHFGGALHFSGAETGRTNPMASRCEAAAMDLFRSNTLRGLVIRAQYCKRGPQIEKVAWINAQERGTALTLRAYRQELSLGRAWMQGRLTLT